MIEKISLRIFWGCMLVCASMVLSVVWVPFNPEGTEMPLRVQFIITFFVIGLAFALIWIPLVVYRFYRKLG